jgi:3-hydroxybutyryl-CoA dehydratase
MATRMIEQSLQKGIDPTPVSLGYDGVRFPKPVFSGDTVAVSYTIEEIDLERQRRTAKVEVANQRGRIDGGRCNRSLRRLNGNSAEYVCQ